MQKNTKHPANIYAKPYAKALTSFCVTSACALTCANAVSATEMEADNLHIKFDKTIETAHPSQPNNWVAVETTVLADMRGGFALETGLKISFGIERTVSINGTLLASTNFNIQNAGAISHAPNTTNRLNQGTVQLIQNGLGNTFQPGQLSQAATSTFIQNSLNGQTIQSQTVINVTTNSMEMMKNMNLHTTLRDAITGSTGLR